MKKRSKQCLQCLEFVPIGTQKCPKCGLSLKGKKDKTLWDEAKDWLNKILGK